MNCSSKLGFSFCELINSYKAYYLLLILSSKKIPYSILNLEL